MGQQQLLLVILVTILVGIATVVAINVFGTQAEQANRDAVRQDLLGAAAQAQGYYQRPDMMGGGGNSFDEIGIEDLGIAGVTENDPANENGCYDITEGLSDQFTIEGHPSSDGNYDETPCDSDDPIEAIVQFDTDGQVEIIWDS